MSLSGRQFSQVIAILSCIAGIALQFIPAPDGVDASLLSIAGVVVFAVGLITFALVMLVAGRAMAKLGPRKLVAIGGATLGAGYILAGRLCIINQELQRIGKK